MFKSNLPDSFFRQYQYYMWLSPDGTDDIIVPYKQLNHKDVVPDIYKSLEKNYIIVRNPGDQIVFQCNTLNNITVKRITNFIKEGYTSYKVGNNVINKKIIVTTNEFPQKDRYYKDYKDFLGLKENIKIDKIYLSSSDLSDNRLKEILNFDPLKLKFDIETTETTGFKNSTKFHKRYSSTLPNGDYFIISYDAFTFKYYPYVVKKDTHEQISLVKIDKSRMDNRSGYKSLKDAKNSILKYKDFLDLKENIKIDKNYFKESQRFREPERSKPKGSLTVNGYYSPAPGKLPEKLRRLLAKVYASCRKNNPGEDKEKKKKCAKSAWGVVNKQRRKENVNYRITESLNDITDYKSIENLKESIDYNFVCNNYTLLLDIYNKEHGEKMGASQDDILNYIYKNYETIDNFVKENNMNLKEELLKEEDIQLDHEKMKKNPIPKDLKSKWKKEGGVDNPEYKQWIKQHWAKEKKEMSESIIKEFMGSDLSAKDFLEKRLKESDENKEEIFIRVIKDQEKNSKSLMKKAMQDIPDKEGYETVYKPYGSEGRGFYYIKKESLKESSPFITQDEYQKRVGKEYEDFRKKYIPNLIFKDIYSFRTPLPEDVEKFKIFFKIKDLSKKYLNNGQNVLDFYLPYLNEKNVKIIKKGYTNYLLIDKGNGLTQEIKIMGNDNFPYLVEWIKFMLNK